MERELLNATKREAQQIISREGTKYTLKHQHYFKVMVNTGIDTLRAGVCYNDASLVLLESG